MRKRLYRSRRDQMIAGVAAGMAAYLDLDPTLVRLGWVLLALSGPGVLLYLLAAVVIPPEPAPGAGDAAAGQAEPAGPVPQRDGARTLGWILIGVGVLLLLERYSWFSWQRLWPAALILLGVYLLAGKPRDSR